jgi:hypothetical protein
MYEITLLGNKTLSSKALDLLHFDRDSILQAVAGRGGAQPTVFVADPERYEHNGRLLRDSETPRLVAYAPDDNTLYANDGCNSCTHVLQMRMKDLDESKAAELSRTARIPEELVKAIAKLS